MALPIPNLDDRRFDDLVNEAKARLARHLPELTQLSPGDPIYNFVDVFAWLTETILYRANLIPERQRRVFLNLLQIPLRPARPARGLVCIDARLPTARLPALLASESQLKAGDQTFSTVGEVQATPLQLHVLVKERLSSEDLAAMGITEDQLRQQFGVSGAVAAFQPRTFMLGEDSLSLSKSLDKAYYLALAIPAAGVRSKEALRRALAGITLNMGIAPADDQEGVEVSDLRPRELIWELVQEDDEGRLRFLPLQVVDDSSLGGRRVGVVRLRLPRNSQLLVSPDTGDPQYAGQGAYPPEPPGAVKPEQVAFWLRLRSSEEPDLPLGYLGVNGVEVVGQGVRRDIMVGVGTGEPDQVVTLPDKDVDGDSLALEVVENEAWVRWQGTDLLTQHGPQDRVYRLDSAEGLVQFGDGLRGRRPAKAARIRALTYRYGGGTKGNLPARSLKELSSGGERLVVRHEWPLTGGLDAETVEQAERRIPEFLAHRERAVTADDFRALAVANPLNPVARAEVRPGFLPGNSIHAVREDVPGAVSVFVLPPGTPAPGPGPRPTQGLLKDVFSYLRSRTLLGTEIYVLSPEFVPIAVSVNVQVLDPQTEQQTLRAVEAALVDYLWPLAPGGPRGEGWPFGGAVSANELMTQVARVAGVRSVVGLSLFRKDGETWKRQADRQPVSLLSYQLPELLRVSAGTGSSATPELPAGLAPEEEGGGAGAGRVPVPVIPDIC